MHVRLVVLAVTAVTALGLRSGRSSHSIDNAIPLLPVSDFGVGLGLRLRLDPVLGDLIPASRLRSSLERELAFVPDDVSALFSQNTHRREMQDQHCCQVSEESSVHTKRESFGSGNIDPEPVSGVTALCM
jgi:hypothetical protein